MTPGSYEPKTAREMVGDALARSIEAKARADADSGKCDMPSDGGDTYQSAVMLAMRRVIYADQFLSRQRRNERKGLGE